MHNVTGETANMTRLPKSSQRCSSYSQGPLYQGACSKTELHHTCVGMPRVSVWNRYLCKVAAVVVELEVVQVDDVCGDDVEELSVVGYHYERLLPSLQILLPRMHTIVS